MDLLQSPGVHMLSPATFYSSAGGSITCTLGSHAGRLGGLATTATTKFTYSIDTIWRNTLHL